MKSFKYVAALFVTPLLVACSGEIDFNFETPFIDVDSISVGEIHRNTLTGEIASEGDNVFFDFYEVSDFHGAVNYSTEDKTIGLAKMADYFSKKREANPGGTIVLSSGDMYQGSAESNLTHGYIVNYSMNVMGFEAMTLGNHEFDWGLDWLKKEQSLKVDDFAIPYLGANVYDKATGQILDFLKPSTVITRGDYKIGIVGTIGDGADKSIMKSLVEGLEFKPELAIASAEAQRLKSEEGCNVVIWSSHRDVNELSGLGVTKAMGIDAVFGGHTHKNSPSEGEEALVNSDGIPFTETKNYGQGIAHARVTLNKESKEIVTVTADCDVEPYQHTELSEHPTVKAIMDVYNQHIDPIKSKVIGKTDAELEVSDTFSLTNLCVDTMRLAANKWGKENGEIKVLAAFHNANGGVRANMAAGNITFGDVYKSFPFDNEIILVKTTGKKLKTYLTQASYGIWRDVEAIPNWEGLADDAECYFTTTDFMATSSKFAFKLSETDLIRTNYIVRDCVAARIESQGNIKQSEFTRDNEQFRVLSRR